MLKNKKILRRLPYCHTTYWTPSSRNYYWINCSTLDTSHKLTSTSCHVPFFYYIFIPNYSSIRSTLVDEQFCCIGVSVPHIFLFVSQNLYFFYLVFKISVNFKF